MIQDKLFALAALGAEKPTSVAVTIWPSKTTPGYTDTTDNLTVEELRYAAEIIRKAAKK